MDYSGYISYILAALFVKEASHLQDRLVDLIERNYALGGPKEGFLYRGTFHTLIPVRLQRSIETKKMVHPDLRPEVVEYMVSRDTYEHDHTRAKNGLQFLFGNCNSPQEARDILPNSIASLDPELSQLSRVFPAGICFRSMPMAMHQYEQIIDLLEYYNSNRLL